jgi:hypothetical protein
MFVVENLWAVKYISKNVHEQILCEHSHEGGVFSSPKDDMICGNIFVYIQTCFKTMCFDIEQLRV